MADDRMFAQLMEEEPAKNPVPRSAQPIQPPREKRDAAEPSLLEELEDLGAVGYTSHSYRLTETELRWLRRFSMHLSERLDQTVSHNTLIRLLLRVANQEWQQNPDHNRLLDLLSQLKK